jgi:CRP-like cAMP-binding protein
MGGDGARAEDERPAPLDPALVADTPILGGLPDHALGRLIDAAHVVRLAEGEAVINEGAPPRGMFILREGELEICKRGRTGAEFCLATLRPGDCVGEMSLIDIQPCSATVRALRPSVLYMLEHAQIARLYKTDVEVYLMLVLNIAREISRRLRRADDVLVDMGVAVGGPWQDD